MAYSPILAIATGIFESFAALAALFSPGRKRILYPVTLLFLILAGYQFSEVAVCAHPGNLLFTRLAFFDITWLPAIGLWLVYILNEPKKRWLKIFPLAYFAAALVFAVWIAVDPNSVTMSVCQVVIARYSSLEPFNLAYGIFYHFGLAVFIFWAAAAMAGADDPIIRKHLANLQTGVLGFLLPSFLLRMLLHEPRGIMPSAMCHFALILAVSLCAVVIRERRLSRRPEKAPPSSSAEPPWPQPAGP